MDKRFDTEVTAHSLHVKIFSFMGRLLAHRRLLACLSAGACVLVLASVFGGDSRDTTSVLVAHARIEAGATITADDVSLVDVPTALVPDHAITSKTEAVGFMAAAPIPRGAIITADSLASASGVTPGHVIIPLSVSPHLLPVLRPGSVVSIFLTDAAGQASATRGIRVVTIPQSSGSGMLSSGSDTVILVEVPESLAKEITSGASFGGPTVALE